MAHLTFNGQRIQMPGNGILDFTPGPTVGGVIDFQADGKITFDSEPDITGSQTITLNMYLDTDTSTLNFSIKTPTNDFMLLTYNDPPDWAGTDSVLAVHVKNSPGVVRQFYDISSYIGEITTVEIVKTSGAITSVTVGGDTLTKVGDGYFDIGASSLKELGGSYASVWDVEIDGSHKWVGYPDGDQDSAWEDTIGSIDGTVSGTVTTRDLF